MNTNSGKAVQAVIFDLDGVLMDSEWMSFLVWREYVENRGGRLEDSAYPHMIGLTAEETAAYVMQSCGINFDIAESCSSAWEQIGKRLQGPIDPLPGAAELVRDLHRRGLPMAIASNSPRDYVDNALHGLSFSDFFPVRVGVDQVPQGKPAPDLYLRVAELLKVTPANCIAVEDSRVGVQSAAAAGMRVLAVPAQHPGENIASHNFNGAWGIFSSLKEAHDTLKVLLP